MKTDLWIFKLKTECQNVQSHGTPCTLSRGTISPGTAI